MTKLNLASVRTLHLLIELLKGGTAGSIQNLLHLEPIDPGLLVDELHRRTGLEFGADFQAWYEWYQGESSGATDADKTTLRMIKEMKERDLRFVAKARRRRDGANDLD